MPPISDFGLHGFIRDIFTYGLAITGLALGVAISDSARMRYDILDSIGAGGCYLVLNLLVGFAGLMNALAVGCIGFNPWHEALWRHCVCAFVIFFGGTSWACGNLVLLRRMCTNTAFSHLSMLSFSHIIQRWLLVVAAASLFLMMFMLRRTFTGGASFDSIFHNANVNFTAHCRSDAYGWPEEASWAFSFEWALVLSLIGSVGTMFADLESYSVLLSSGCANHAKGD